MHICNIGNRPTFKNVIREEVLDITLASTGIMDKIENWKVSEEETFSDHNLIEYELNLTQQSQTEEFRNVKKTRWSQYQHELTKKVEEKKISETEELDEMVEKVNEAIIEAYHKSNKPRKKKQGDLKPPWWSNDLDSLKARVKRCDKKYRRTKQDEDRIARNRAANEYRSAFEKAKKKAWREYCSGIGKTDEASRIVKIMKNGRRADISTIQRKNGTFTGNQIETLQELTNTLFPECQREEKQISESNIQLIEENEELSPDTAEEIVNTARITAAIKMFKPYKSPGKDGIYPILLQRGLEILTPHLARIYRTSITSGRPPKQWLITKAVFIPKPGKDDYTKAKSYRPISLTSFLLKGLEKLIYWHIQDKHLSRQPTSRNVFSYKEGVSTETALHEVTKKIEWAFSNRQYALAVYLDISGAFSNTSANGMIETLARKGVEKQIMYWIAEMLKKRTVYASLGEEKF